MKHTVHMVLAKVDVLVSRACPTATGYSGITSDPTTPKTANFDFEDALLYRGYAVHGGQYQIHHRVLA